MTPVVYLEDGILHAHTLHTLLQFLEENHTGIVQILIVDANRKYEMTEKQLRYLAAPSHLLTCFEACAHVFQEEAGWIVSNIS